MMNRGADRNRTRSGAAAPKGAALALRLAAVLLLAACSEGPTFGFGEFPDPRFSLTVKVTNVGNGFGRAEVVFSAGATQNPCAEVLGPGESCSPFVISQVRPETAAIQVSAEPGSRFVGWEDDSCTGMGTSGECTVRNEQGDFNEVIAVEPRFDLVTGG
ncbi:MAG: hypothetical protein JSW46_02355 [Gemmatimonadota bacterium]|nr:MAG: hypothetical protein JSW46_02355 [Gemmatimonadota bacterium]